MLFVLCSYLLTGDAIFVKLEMEEKHIPWMVFFSGWFSSRLFFSSLCSFTNQPVDESPISSSFKNFVIEKTREISKVFVVSLLLVVS